MSAVGRRGKLSKMKLKLLLLFLFTLLMVVGGVRTVLMTFKSRERLVQLEREVEQLRREDLSLKEELSYREGDDFLEKEARERLKMVKEGEKLVILPENLKVLGEQAQEEKAVKAAIPVWRQWWELFFGR